MPSAITAAPPGIAEPVHVAATSLLGLEAKGHDGQHSLQATPSSSASCHGTFAVGSVYRIASKGSLKRSRGLVTYVARGVGVVVVDTATQAATFSSSFSTSYQPITPPLVVHDATRQAAFLALWPRTEEQEAELHVWSEGRDSSTSSASTLQQHHICPIERDVTSLHPLSAREILACHADGRASIISFGSLQNLELRTASTTVGPKRNSSRATLFLSLLDSTSASNLLVDGAQKSQQSLAVIVTAPERAASPSAKSGRKARKSAIEIIDAAEQSGMQSTSITVTYLTADEQSKQTNETRIAALESADIQTGAAGKDSSHTISATRASLHSSGRLMLLAPDGVLTCVALRSTPSGTPTVRRVAQTRVDTSSASSSTILAVSPASVIIACLDAARQYIHLVLLDVELGSALAEYTLKAPEDCSMLFLHGLGISSAVLLTGPSSTAQGKAQAHIWSISYEAGEGSHLRWALSSRHLTQKWIVAEKSATTIGANGNTAQLMSHQDGDSASARSLLLVKLTQLLNGGKDTRSTADAMNAAFDSWYNAALSSAQGSDKTDAHQRQANGTRAEDDVRVQTPLSLPQAFVAAITAVALSAPSVREAKSRPYAGRIVHALLDQKLLRNAFVPSHAVLAYLLEVGDWTAVRQSLLYVDDLAEDDVVDVIGRAATADTSKVTISLDKVLATTIVSNLSAAEIRKAMKDRLDVSHVASILEVLVRWLTPQSEQPLLSTEPHTADRRGADSEDEERPSSINSTLAFAINVLDTFFPAILATPSMHTLLAELSQAIKAQLITVNQLTVLRGPLAAFSQLSDDRARKAGNTRAARRRGAGHVANGDDDDDDDDDDDIDAARLWSTTGPDHLGGRAGKPRAGASVMLQVGGGGTLSRSGVQERTRKQHSYANSVAVGLYALEQFMP